MAKVDTLTLHIEGKEYNYNINVGKSGMFTCSIDWKVAQLIGIDSGKLEFSKLSDLCSYILIPYHKYLDSKIELTLWIGITYTVNGLFSRHPETGEQFVSSMWGDHTDFYDNSGFSIDPDKMGFYFNVFFKESRSTGVETWYKAKKGLSDNPEGWSKNGTAHGMPKILIPYSDEAYSTLVKAEKGLQAISFSLFQVLSQDKHSLLETLEGGKMLGYTNEVK